MKKLAKWLAIFAFVVILGAAWKSVITTKAEDPAACAPNGTMKILGPACGPEPAFHPDINIKLRGFERTEGPGPYNIWTVQSDAPDPKHPRLDTMFDNVLDHAVVGLYHVGVWEGKKNGVYTDWVHLVGFSASPTDDIKVPTSGYTLGCGMAVMVLYADDNSITLKYTLDDNMVSGYGIHILGIEVDPKIKAAYKAANAAGRKELPVLKAQEVIGHPLRSSGAVWISVRDTGAFLDPRSYYDFWSTDRNLIGQLPLASHLDLPADYDLSSGVRGPKSPACDVSGFQKQAYYPPLGSLQECPVEYPTVGTVTLKTDDKTNPPPGSCTIDTAMVKSLLDVCAHPEKGVPKDFCANGFGNPMSINWCPGQYKDILAAANETQHFCPNADEQQIKRAVGEDYERLCHAPDNPDDPGNMIYEAINQCKREYLPDFQKHVVDFCQAEKRGFNLEPTNQTTPPPAGAQVPLLPVCVPTADKTQAGRCTSACGDKLTISESLGFNILNNCATGTCKATVKIDPTTPLYAPLAKNLADYFAGSLDAGAVAEGTITKERLKELQKALATGAVTEADYATLADSFDQAGVARKLLPLELQDQLKCQFIKYVNNKIDNKQNTKYKYNVDGKETYFEIDGVSVRDYKLPPYFDPDNKKYDPADINVGCKISQYDPLKLPAWLGSPSGLAWNDVPLFDNDEAQGKIEFVSGGVFTNELNPIQTSIPDIRRLNSATNVIQEALLPIETSLPPDERPAAITPQSRFLTIGPEIRPKLVLNACTKTPDLKKLYDDYDLKQTENAKKGLVSQIYYPEPGTPSYVLGVECLQNGGNLPKDTASLSKVCSVGPEGQINCFQQLPPDELPDNGRKDFPDIPVQTRNVTPYLFDAYLQTIDQGRGVLRIFQPYAIKEAGANKLDQFRANEEFEKNFLPLPAESNKIKYLLNSNTGVTLKQEDGWKLLFDKLGGIYTAKQFVLQLLKPEK